MGIVVEQVSKQFGAIQVLTDISFTVPEHSITALLGPSGCGKTTLLRIVAGLEQATTGKVFIGGQDSSVMSAQERNIGFVFQNYALFGHLTVFENIAFGLRVRPKAQRPEGTVIQQRVEHLLELVQLSHLAKRYPSELSGGQRQRVALARALAVEPKLLLLDEPFGALDAKVRKELRAWLGELLHELQVTTVFVTHDQEEAFELADEVVLLNKGHIEQKGAAQSLYRAPASPFVYEFIGGANKIYLQRNATNPKQWQLAYSDTPLHAEQISVSAAQVGATPDPENLQKQAEAVGYLRFHDVGIALFAGTSTWPATITRITHYGRFARVLCRLDEVKQPTTLEAELSQAQLRTLGLKEGQQIHCYAKQLEVFPIEAAVTVD